MKRNFFGSVTQLFIAIFFYGQSAYAETTPADFPIEQIYQNAVDAFAQDDLDDSDFWIARYMGLQGPDIDKNQKNKKLETFWNKRTDLQPTAFISGRFTDDFLDFFINKSSHLLWGGSEDTVDYKNKIVMIQSYSDEQYFVEIFVSPRIEKLFVMKESPKMAVISYGVNPRIVSGKINGKQRMPFKEMALNAQDAAIHFVWPIERHDLDGDNIPEIWIRYIQVWASGFSQELAIYKIKNETQLVLMKQFSGEAEGIARRLDVNKVEVGTGYSDKEVGHLGFDRTHLEIWEFKNGEFFKTSETNTPHVLMGKSWDKYY